jgi:hypothetical protein
MFPHGKGDHGEKKIHCSAPLRGRPFRGETSVVHGPNASRGRGMAALHEPALKLCQKKSYMRQNLAELFSKRSSPGLNLSWPVWDCGGEHQRCYTHKPGVGGAGIFREGKSQRRLPRGTIPSSFFIKPGTGFTMGCARASATGSPRSCCSASSCGTQRGAWMPRKVVKPVPGLMGSFHGIATRGSVPGRDGTRGLLDLTPLA